MEKEQAWALKSNKRSDGLGAIGPRGRLNNHELDLMDHPSDRWTQAPDAGFGALRP